MSNGLTQSGSGQGNDDVYSGSTTYSATDTFDWYGKVATIVAHAQSCSVNTQNSGWGFNQWYQNSQPYQGTGLGCSLGAGGDVNYIMDFWTGSSFQSDSPIPVTPTASPSTNAVYTTYWRTDPSNEANTLIGAQLNYGPAATLTFSSSYASPTGSYTIGWGNGYGSSTSSYFVQWARLRTSPPNSLMPGVHFGSVV